MSIAVNRAAPAHKSTDKLPGVDRIVIIFGSSAILWAGIASAVVHCI